MSTLHVLSHSPFTDSRLTSCLRLLGPADGVLLCGDASYALTDSTAALQALQAHSANQVFVLEEDIQARSMVAPEWVQVVDYPGFVELSIRFDKVNTWL
ncbi:sulfur relay protein DsrH [Pseudomonas sp. S25]|uniref:Sulfur relay protein DsrH n=1 Tax=Pseudomonas maioricensis TaxID=1766623 RepID=A0ABS9ZR53_9PSED|nr:sulfurtransferase complex subunit TusB [Pseudomonas sp. S25]MCI8212373.1 sulfur relay protein DsrH [Pseudomonas sp. S25]